MSITSSDRSAAMSLGAEPTKPSKAASDIPYFAPPNTGDAKELLRRDPLLGFIEPYRELGPVFRTKFIGRDCIVMAGLEANEAIWSNNEYWDYVESNKHFREQFNDTYLNQLEGERFYRKLYRTRQGLKPKVLMGQSSAMSDAFFEEIEPLLGTPVDLRSLAMRLYICMVGQVLMQTKLPKGMDRCMAISNADMLRAGTLGKYRHLFYLKPSRIWRRWKIFRFLARILDEREKKPVAPDDILANVLGAHPASEPPIPRQELIYDLSQLMMGGSTTTPQIMTFTLMFLAKHPEWLAELREELAAWDAHGFTSMAPYPKLKATLLEIERLRPPSVAITRVAAKAFTFGGYTVPKGSRVVHLQTLCHFLPEHYDDPTAFKPQRFLDDPDLPAKHVHGLFGGGGHGCVGVPLVRMLTPLFVANMIKRYDIDFAPDMTLDAHFRTMVTPATPKVMATIRPRRQALGPA